MTTPAIQKRSTKAIIACAIGTILLLGLDLKSKDWALENLSRPPAVSAGEACVADDGGFITYQRDRGEPVVVSEGWFELRYAENCGAAFGMLRNAPPVVRHGIFGTAAIIASIALFWMFAQGKGGPFFAWSVPFIVSGALGNLADRFRLGYVVDFIRWYWTKPLPFIGSEWPTFNVADITITIGVVCLMIDGWFEGKEAKVSEAKKKQVEKFVA